jgi:hypothetical protein
MSRAGQAAGEGWISDARRKYATAQAIAGSRPIRALRSSTDAMINRVSQPEIQRQVRQQRADIDALYELVERVDQKVDALDVKLDSRFDEISGQLSEVLRQLGVDNPKSKCGGGIHSVSLLARLRVVQPVGLTSRWWLPQANVSSSISVVRQLAYSSTW